MVGQICGLDFNPEAAHYEKHDGITDEGYTLQRWMEGTLLDGVWPDTQGKARYYASDDNFLITNLRIRQIRMAPVQCECAKELLQKAQGVACYPEYKGNEGNEETR